MAYADALDTPPSQLAVSAASRRADMAQDENQASGRKAKLGRRESRLGLKSIFGRSRAANEIGSLQHTTHGPKSTSLFRASIAELGYWPDAQSSEAALSSWHHLPATPEAPPRPDQPASHHQVNAKEHAPALRSSKQARNTVANWSMPPLFKAFPQAVRHVTLPAATISADAILRLNEKKNSRNLPDDAASSAHAPEHEAREGAVDRERRKHRRNASASADSLEWTTKIYVFVTSGYVLQYAGHGHFDRLPEKILRLGPTSAAFATDAIPGRHWVLHVSSTAEADGTPTLESRSLFSKLPFRMDRRNTSNLLMVFESAHVMESWMTALRGEIERLGGKKYLSETGRPKTAESSPQLRERHSQRTLIVRDVSRFSRSGAGNATSMRGRETRSGAGSVRMTSPDTIRGQSLDDDSTSNSIVSQNERQLDSLRESSNRLSLNSSGERTIVTSADSSPERSPTRSSSASHLNGTRAGEYSDVVVRPRPNASDIAFRRQSVRVGSPFVGQDHHLADDDEEMRPPSVAGTIRRGDGVLSPVGGRPTPNFSVPNSSSRRFSHARAPLAEADGLGSPPGAYDASPPGAWGKPPPAWRASRTLSMVMDHPNPRDAAAERPTTGHRGGRRAAPPKWASQQQLRCTPRSREGMHGDGLSGRPNSVSKGPQNRRVGGASISPRRPPSVNGATGKQDGRVPGRGRGTTLGQDEGHDDVVLTAQPRGGDTERYRSSFLDIGSPRSRSVEPTRAAPRASRSSMLSERGRSRPYDAHDGLLAEPPLAAPPTAPLPKIPARASSPYLRVDTTTAKALLNRRSMPQLAEGPPPAPPPTRALPPIPHKLQVKA